MHLQNLGPRQNSTKNAVENGALIILPQNPWTRYLLFMLGSDHPPHSGVNTILNVDVKWLYALEDPESKQAFIARRAPRGTKLFVWRKECNRSSSQPKRWCFGRRWTATVAGVFQIFERLRDPRCYDKSLQWRKSRDARAVLARLLSRSECHPSARGRSWLARAPRKRQKGAPQGRTRSGWLTSAAFFH